MPPLSQLAGLLLLSVAAGQPDSPPIGVTSLTTPSPSSSSATSTTSSITTSSSSTTTLTTAPGPTRWELTGVFTQPPECTNGITAYAGALSTLGYWLNIPYPAPGVTLTSCFPPVLAASATAAVDLPPYEQLVCPWRWEHLDVNSTYHICCPYDFGFYLGDDKDRLGQGAWCTSWVAPGTHAVLTQYQTDGGSTLIDTTLSSGERWMVQATAFDGTIATHVATPTSTSTSTSSSTSTSASSSHSSATPTTTTTTTTTTTKTSTTPVITTPSWTGPTAISALPSCGQTCISNMLGKYQELGCAQNDAACLCRAPNFNYGVRDCANAACPDSGQAGTVIAFETSYYCPRAMATGTDSPTQAPTPTAISDLPQCGQTCMNNMIGQYAQLGCGSPDPRCLCKNANFGYGVRDCADAACGTAVAPTVTRFASSHYCVDPPATSTPVPLLFAAKAHYNTDCTGAMHNDVAAPPGDGLCVDTACQVGSLDIAAAGSCPDGHVQISYWEQPGCQGAWYGYGYASRGTCRTLWSGGWDFKSLWVKCADPKDSCVNQGTCKEDPEPTVRKC